MKISPIAIILIGVSVAIIVLSFAYFQHYAPNMEERGYYEEYANQLEIEANKMNLAEQRVANARAEVEAKAAEWRNVVATRTPPPQVALGGVSLAVNMWQLTVDSRRFRNNIQRAVNAQVRSGGVEVLNGPEIPMPTDDPGAILASFYNYPAIPFPVVIFDLGTVTVRGTQAQINANVRNWSNMPRYLAVVDGLAITGTSPRLTATYNLSIIGYIRTPENVVFGPAPAGAAPGGGGAPPSGGMRGGGGPAPVTPDAMMGGGG